MAACGCRTTMRSAWWPTEEIGLPRSVAEQIMIHFGKAVPGDFEYEPMPEAPSSESALPESELGFEAVELPESELELLELPEPE